MYCTICLKKVKETNKVLTNCKHTFHLSCILKNYKYNTDSGNKCPICRNYLFSTNPENHIINGSTFSPLRSVGAASPAAGDAGWGALYKEDHSQELEQADGSKVSRKKSCCGAILLIVLWG